MNDAGLAVVDHAEMQLVGKRGSIPKLKQRPGQRDREKVRRAEAGRLASASVGFRNHGFERFARWYRLNTIRHRVPHLNTLLPRREGAAPHRSLSPNSHPAFFLVEFDRARMQR